MNMRFQRPCGLWGLFYFLQVTQQDDGYEWFQRPCGLWGLFYRRDVLEQGNNSCSVSAPVWALGSFLLACKHRFALYITGFSARVGSGVFSTLGSPLPAEIVHVVSAPVWALGSFLPACCRWPKRGQAMGGVSAPVWALGSFLRS